MTRGYCATREKINVEEEDMKASGSLTRNSRVAPLWISSLGMCVLAGLLMATLVGCEKDEPPPPLPSAAPAATPTPQTQLTITEEDAAVDAEEEPKKGTGKGRPGGSLGACCAALEQNAANAPEPNATYMKSAALACRSAAAAGQTQGAALAGIRAALQTAGMPTACK
jgi:hypothetical protein